MQGFGNPQGMSSCHFMVTWPSASPGCRRHGQPVPVFSQWQWNSLERNWSSRNFKNQIIEVALEVQPPFFISWFPSFTIILVGIYHLPKGTTISLMVVDFQGNWSSITECNDNKAHGNFQRYWKYTWYMFFSIFSSNIKSLTYWMYQIHFDGSLRHLSIQLSNPILAIDGGIHWETLLMGDVSLFRFSNICSWCDHVLQSTKMCSSFKSSSFWKTRESWYLEKEMSHSSLFSYFF